MSHKNLLGPARQKRGEPIYDSTVQTDFWVKSVEEQGMIDSVERGAKIQQNKKSFVSPVDHRQQVIEYAKKGGVSAMATSIRRLKLDMQIVCV